MATISIRITGENEDLLRTVAQSINSLKDLKNVGTNAGSAVGQVGKRGADGMNQATKSSTAFGQSLANVTVIAGGIVMALGKLKDIAKAIVGPGFEYQKSMEQTELGMAGIIQSMTTMNGKAISFSQAMGIASNMTQKLQQDALRTAATTEELVSVFRAILAPGISSGMTLDQIRQITVAGTNAAKSMGLPKQQLVQEIRDLVQGGIQAASSTLATSLGLTDADIEKAKNSSEGLFKFLMDRLQGFNDAAEKFPDTIGGKIDQLEEVWTRASAAFFQKFEKPVKDGIQSITDLLGKVDTKTGTFEINPAIVGIIDEINTGLRELKNFAEDVGPSFDWVKTDVLPALKDLMQAIKDITSVVLDSVRMIAKVAKPVFEYLANEFRIWARNLATITGWLRDKYNFMARDSGTKKDRPPDIKDPDKTTSNSASGANDASELKAKFEQQEQLIKKSQEALKIAEEHIKADAEITKQRLKQELERIDLLKQQNQISAAEYAQKKAQLEQQIQQVDVERSQRTLEAVNASRFKEDSDKRERQAALNEEIRVGTENLKSFGTAVTEVTGVLSSASAEGKTWAREVGSVNIDGLKDKAKTAIDMMGDWFFKETGRKMTVSSGLRDWGGHVNGLKFDVVDDAATELLEKNQNGIRDRMIAYAKSLGLSVLDEYVNPSERATGGHLDFSAEGLNVTFAAQAKARIGTMLTKNGADYLKAILELYDQADDIAKALAESKGDVSTRQKAELKAKYDEMIKTFESNKMTPVADMVRELKNAEFLKLDFAQAQKDLETVNGEMVETQSSLLNDLAKGAKSAGQVTQEYADSYNKKIKSTVDSLQKLLEDAIKTGNKPLENSIRADLRKIAETINAFAENVIRQIDADLQNEISRINANRKMTRLQKDDAIDAAQRRAYAQKAVAFDNEALEYRKRGQDDKAIDAEQTATLNRQLAQTPTLLNRIHEASRQGLEDGLLDFLERGVIECKKLGDAVRNLAIAVLQSMQKIYAQEMTKRIMGMFGFGDNARPTIDGRPVQGPLKPDGSFADGGNMESGMVKGPGTRTSDSIFAWVSNIGKFIRISDGEYVIKGSAVAKWGTSFLDSINSGRVPEEFRRNRFAVGGSISARTVTGPQDLAASLVNNNSTSVPLKIVNINDPNEAGRYLQSRNGERVFLNVVKGNSEIIRRILKIKG